MKIIQAAIAALAIATIAAPAFAAPMGHDRDTAREVNSYAASLSDNGRYDVCTDNYGAYCKATIKPLEGSFVNLRVSPGKAIMRKVNKGQKVTAMGSIVYKGNTWVFIVCDGTRGWVIGTSVFVGGTRY